jgi:putative PEP-CTERM system TPR-repeat lipoprotein
MDGYMNISRGIIVLCAVTVLLAACNEGVSESQRLAKANAYEKQGQLKAASIELKNALQKNPDSIQIRMELGKIHLKAGHMAAAEKELAKARSLGAEDELVLPFLGRSLLYQGKYADVVDIPLENLDGESKSEVLALKGLALVALGDITKAKFIIEESMSTGTKSIRAMVANAGILAYTNEVDKSRKQLEEVFKIDPEFAPAWSMLGDIELKQHRFEKAMEAYTKAISFRVNNMSDMLKRATIYIQMKQYDKAQKDIDLLKKKIPLHPGYNYVQGILYFQNKKYRDAQAAFDLALVDEKRYPMALYYAGLTSYLLRQNGRAEKYAAQFLEKYPELPVARKLLALIDLVGLKYKEAEELVRPLVETDTSDTGAMNILASALLKQGKTNESIELLSKVVELKPDSPDAQRRLGLSLMMGGDDAAGEEHLTAATKLDSSNKSGEILLILNYLRQKQYDKAQEAAMAYRDKFPEKAFSYNILGRVYQIIGKKQEAKETFAKALELEPGNPPASQNLADIAINEKDYDKARNYYLTALKKHNKHLGLLMRMAALSSLERDEKSMVHYLKQAIEAYPKAVDPRLALARYYLSEGKNEQVAVLVGEFDQAQMKTPSVLELVSLAQLAKGDYSEAKSSLEQLTRLQPNSPQAHYRLASAYGGMNKPKKMRLELEKSVELAPEYFSARLALAKLLLSSGEIESAQKQITALKKSAPKNPEVLKVEAAVAIQQGQPEQALKLVKAAYEIAPTTKNVLALSNVKWNMQDRDGAVQLFNKWLATHSGDVEVRLALAGSYVMLENKAAAIEQYKIVLSSDENNLIALNNLAWFLQDTNPRKALEYARYANSVAPKSPALMDTLALVLLKNSEVNEAKKVIKDAMIKAPTNLSITYHGAKILAAAGDSDEAVKILKKITGDKVHFPEKKDAQELLAKLVSKK